MPIRFGVSEQTAKREALAKLRIFANKANQGGLSETPRLTRRCSGAAPAPLWREVSGENAAGGSGRRLGWGRPLNLLPLGGAGNSMRRSFAYLFVLSIAISLGCSNTHPGNEAASRQDFPVDRQFTVRESFVLAEQLRGRRVRVVGLLFVGQHGIALEDCGDLIPKTSRPVVLQLSDCSGTASGLQEARRVGGEDDQMLIVLEGKLNTGEFRVNGESPGAFCVTRLVAVERIPRDPNGTRPIIECPGAPWADHPWPASTTDK